MEKFQYLPISAQTTIADIIARDNLLDKKNELHLIEEIFGYINSIEDDTFKILKSRDMSSVTSQETLTFFRCQERYKNAKLILEYLLAFLSKIPLADDIANELVNPFEQFKSFVTFSIGLLNEEDVIKGILAEHEQRGLLNDKNVWYYRGRIKKCYLELVELAMNTQSPLLEDYRKLFMALEKLSLFWFSVRNENLKRIRKCDIYIYKMVIILLNRIKLGNESEKSNRKYI